VEAGQPPLAEQREGGVLLLTLNRPDKRNALSIELRERIASALAELDTDTCGAVVLTGAGSAFCAGMDTTQFGGDRAHRERLVESSLACMRAVGSCPVPVIAAVNGPAVAGGFVLALAADIRVGEPTAKFGFPELPRGIPPSFAWARAALPAGLARELCITGRVLDAGEARSEGVIGELVDAGEGTERALALAAEIAGRPRPAIVETKRRIRLERERLYGFLFEDEELMFRRTLLAAER
jgi:enoyl-CoA hydratase/carnithine racemase